METKQLCSYHGQMLTTLQVSNRRVCVWFSLLGGGTQTCTCTFTLHVQKRARRRIRATLGFELLEHAEARLPP